MVGARKPLRRKDPPKPSRRSPRLHSQNCRRRNTPRVEEIIDISSSYGGTDPQVVENTYPLSQISSPREDGPDEQCVAKRFKCEKDPAAEEFTEQDKLRYLVKCLATIIVNGNTLSPSQRATGLSVLVTTCLSPTPTTNQSTVTKMSDEDGFLAKYSTQSERLTKSAPTGKLVDKMLVFLVYKESNEA
ncbi:PucR family transcriptional regulator [Sesbania bispinosa]|nr:PucR family transcriptional regulator [Sesbania bispinosa]